MNNLLSMNKNLLPGDNDNKKSLRIIKWVRTIKS